MPLCEKRALERKIRIALLCFVVAAWPSASAADRDGPRRPPFFEYEIESLGTNLDNVTFSPSGRYVAWQDDRRLHLLDGFTGERTELPGPDLSPQRTFGSPNLRVDDDYVVWRRMTADTAELTELFLYDIGKRRLVQVYDRAGVNDSPILVAGVLAWEGIVPDGEGGNARHLLIYDPRKDAIEDMTPDTEGSIAWLTGNRWTLAWAEKRAPGVGYREIWAMDVRTRRPVLIDTADEGLYNVAVVGHTIRWTVDSRPRERRAQFLRLRRRCGMVGLELALLAPLWIGRRRGGRSRRCATGRPRDGA